MIEFIILKYFNIIIFGELIDVLNFEFIINEFLEIKFKEFNVYYNKILENIMNYLE